MTHYDARRGMTLSRYSEEGACLRTSAYTRDASRFVVMGRYSKGPIHETLNFAIEGLFPLLPHPKDVPSLFLPEGGNSSGHVRAKSNGPNKKNPPPLPSPTSLSREKNRHHAIDAKKKTKGKCPYLAKPSHAFLFFLVARIHSEWKEREKSVFSPINPGGHVLPMGNGPSERVPHLT